MTMEKQAFRKKFIIRIIPVYNSLKVVKSHKQPISDEQDMKSVEESVCNDIDGADDYVQLNIF